MKKKRQTLANPTNPPVGRWYMRHVTSALINPGFMSNSSSSFHIRPNNTVCLFFFSSRSRHTRCYRDWSSDVCSSDLLGHEDLLDSGHGASERAARGGPDGRGAQELVLGLGARRDGLEDRVATAREGLDPHALARAVALVETVKLRDLGLLDALLRMQRALQDDLCLGGDLEIDRAATHELERLAQEPARDVALVVAEIHVHLRRNEEGGMIADGHGDVEGAPARLRAPGQLAQMMRGRDARHEPVAAQDEQARDRDIAPARVRVLGQNHARGDVRTRLLLEPRGHGQEGGNLHAALDHHLVDRAVIHDAWGKAAVERVETGVLHAGRIDAEPARDPVAAIEDIAHHGQLGAEHAAEELGGAAAPEREDGAQPEARVHRALHDVEIAGALEVVEKSAEALIHARVS